jgi:CTP synthase (UTP-ammonia lyase)
MQQALFTQVEPQCVLTMHDVSNIWRVPGLMESQGAHHTICKWVPLVLCAALLPN